MDPKQYEPAPDVLAGRTVLITGATRGLGRAVATAVARHGGTVILHGRDARALEQLYEDLLPVGPEPAVAQIDLERAQGNEYQYLTDQISKRFGHLDGLVHNAGMLGDRSPIEHYDIGVWQRVMHVNVNAAFILTRCLLPLLKESSDASILFTTSGVGQRGRAYWGAYAASKFAVEGLTQVLADELESTPVRVNCVNPGPTRTRMRAHAYPAEDPNMLRTPESLTGIYLYLLGPDSVGVSGQRIDCQE
jgi:NAD(P)-dependent dehydrogenase (short-subunit alcohol dehydrogenase family)